MSLRQSILSKNLPPPANVKKFGGKRDVTPLGWSEFFDEKKDVTVGSSHFNVYLKGTSGPIFYFLHGGGYSGLTWSCFVSALSDMIECRVICPDLRGHGDSHTENDNDLSKETQVQDVISIFNGLIGEHDESPLCIIGHSMGGALAVHTVAANSLRNVVGVVVIDVVEGSAMDALGGMITFLRGRPSSFNSEEDAIKWCLQSGTSRSSRAARVSMPAQIKKSDDGKYIWRIDLAQSSEYWPGWFQGLSTLFLSCSPPKLLVLAGVDRLDKELMIGQMQGKFQTCVLSRVGHAVHEDSPDKLSEEIGRFAVRYKFAQWKEGVELSSKPVMPLGMML